MALSTSLISNPFASAQPFERSASLEDTLPLLFEAATTGRREQPSALSMLVGQYLLGVTMELEKMWGDVAGPSVEPTDENSTADAPSVSSGDTSSNGSKSTATPPAIALTGTPGTGSPVAPTTATAVTGASSTGSPTAVTGASSTGSPTAVTGASSTGSPTAVTGASSTGSPTAVTGASSAPGPPPTPSGTTPLLSGLYNAYSPDQITVNGQSMLFYGGWQSASDVGNDQIYLSTNGGPPQVVLNGQNGIPNGQGGTEQGIVNDPSVAQVPGTNTLVMTYTFLPNTTPDGQPITNSDPNNPGVSYDEEMNQVGMMISTNGGQSWQNEGIVVGQNNGSNDANANYGAWSPSTVINGNTIDVYYNVNAPGSGVYKSSFNLQTQQFEGTQAVNVPSAQDGGFSNVDVFSNGNTMYMLANTGSDQSIRLLQSTDGGNTFTDVYNAPLIQAGNNPDGSQQYVLTPQGSFDANGNLVVNFGYNPDSSAFPQGSTSIQQWTFPPPPSSLQI